VAQNHNKTGAEMIKIPQLTAKALGSFLAQGTKGRFAASQSGWTELLLARCVMSRFDGQIGR
jgi:hypothetical protein